MSCSFIISDQPFCSLFGYQKNTKLSTTAATPVLSPTGLAATVNSDNVKGNILSGDPDVLEWPELVCKLPVEPVATNCLHVVVEMPHPRDPLTGPQAENASGVCAVGSQVTFTDTSVVSDLGVPPVSTWC